MVLNEVIVAIQKVVLVLSCLLCFGVVLVLCDLYRKRHIFKFARNFNGYPFYPVAGNSYYTIGKGLFLLLLHNVEQLKLLIQFFHVDGIAISIWRTSCQFKIQNFFNIFASTYRLKAYAVNFPENLALV